MSPQTVALKVIRGGECRGWKKKIFFFYNIFQNLEQQTDHYIFIGTHVGNKWITGWINEISKDLTQGFTPGATRRRADWTA